MMTFSQRWHAAQGPESRLRLGPFALVPATEFVRTSMNETIEVTRPNAWVLPGRRVVSYEEVAAIAERNGWAEPEVVS